MSNRNIQISKEGKEMLDTISNILEIERPETVKISLAKGLDMATGPCEIKIFQGSGKWAFPDGVIKDKEYLIFKHLIINEQCKLLSDSEVSKYIQYFIEIGIREIMKVNQRKNSLDDFRLLIL